MLFYFARESIITGLHNEYRDGRGNLLFSNLARATPMQEGFEKEKILCYQTCRRFT